MAFSKDQIQIITDTAHIVRMELEKKYGMHRDSMMGKCIEASDTLVARLMNLRFNAEAKQVWVLYQDFETCSNYCFEEHWIVEVTSGAEKVYIDLTMDQFQWAFNFELPRIWFGKRLATFLLPRKPGRDTLKKCGWTDWYNTGYYVNCFEYRL